MSNTPATVLPTLSSTALPVGRLASVGAVIFCANAALLVLQLVASKLLAPFIGSSLETWTSIIGVFLAGIALGNAFGGRLADRYPSPRTLVILLFLGAAAALWMLLFPMILSSTGVHQSLGLVPRIPILAAALCLPAGFVLSLLTPLAIKLGLPDVGHTGRVAGLIFGLSTFGCLIGNYLTGFYLIPSFTINTLVLVAAGVLVLLAASSLLMLRSSHDGPAVREVRPTETPASPNAFAFADIKTAYLIVFLASFCGMTLELTASRVLAQQLGVSLFTWTGVIGVMLAGTALGNFMGGQLADRPRHASALLAGAVVLLATLALTLLFSLMLAHKQGLPVEYALGIAPDKWGTPLYGKSLQIYLSETLPEQLPRLKLVLVMATALGLLLGMPMARHTARFVTRAGGGEPLNPRNVLAATLCFAGGTSVLVLATLGIVTRYNLFETWEPITQVMIWTFSLFFLPMFMLGMVSPQVIRLSVPDVAHVGRVAGRVYAWSTVGAIVGTFAAGYFLLSTFGVYRTILTASLAVTLLSLVVTKMWDKHLLLYLFSIVTGGVVGGYILSGRHANDEVLAKVESNYYTIRVIHSPFYDRVNTLSLHLDRLLHSVVDPTDPTYLYYTHEHIQIEFLRLAKANTIEPNALVIGGGGYTYPRFAMEVMPEVKMDVVEIDPKVTEVARTYLGLKEYPNLHIYHMDGRQFVTERAVRGSYDLVIQDAVNDFSVPSHLMTKEYNDAIKAILRPNEGMYLLTIIDSVGTGKLWKAAMATLEKTFQHVVLLTADTVPQLDHPTSDGWDEKRRVMVIYASDRPFDLSELYREVADQISPGFAAGMSVFAPLRGDLFAVPLITQSEALVYPSVPFHTIPVPANRLIRFTAREPGVILTDQYCPIDNLMADVFRNR